MNLAYAPSVSFAELGVPDIDVIYDLERLCFTKYHWSRELIASEFFNEVSLVLGIEVSGKLIGYTFAHVILDELHILSLGIAPEYQNQGYGVQLIAQLMSLAKSRGCKRGFLEVRTSNTVAQHLYSKLNFQVVGLRPNYYQDNGEDALLMEAQF